MTDDDALLRALLRERTHLLCEARKLSTRVLAEKFETTASHVNTLAKQVERERKRHWR